MKPLRILVTTVGGLTSPEILNALRENGERPVTLIGVDAFEEAVGRYFVDEFYVLPDSAKQEDYFVKAVYDLAKRCAIDVIVPCGNEDNLALSRRRSESPCAIMVGSYETLSRAYDKATVYEELQAEMPQVAPNFRVVKDLKDFQTAAEALGYPANKVVVKPRFGRGGRGVYILSSGISLSSLLTAKPEASYGYSYFEQLIEDQGLPFDLIVMECLAEPFHSVYSLCLDGVHLISLDHIREWGVASQTYRGLVRADANLSEIARNVIKKFSLSFTVNMEFATTSDGRTVLFDLNPRIAASCAVDRDIGVNFPYYAAKLALKEHVQLNFIDTHLPKRFTRYFSHIWS